MIFRAGAWMSKLGKRFKVTRAQVSFEGKRDTFTELASRETGLLPDAMRRRVGLTLAQQTELVKLNDGGASFPEIADTIERFAQENEGA
jgi:hypothetical protein